MLSTFFNQVYAYIDKGIIHLETSTDIFPIFCFVFHLCLIVSTPSPQREVFFRIDKLPAVSYIHFAIKSCNTHFTGSSCHKTIYFWFYHVKIELIRGWQYKFKEEFCLVRLKWFMVIDHDDKIIDAIKSTSSNMPRMKLIVASNLNDITIDWAYCRLLAQHAQSSI